MDNKADNGMMVAVRVSLTSNAVLFCIKLATLFVVNSLAVAADLGISIVSLGVSVLLYHAIKMSNKPADPLHNYGYGKIENVAEAIEGIVLIGLAVAMTVQAVLKLINPGEEIHSPVIGLVASLAGVAINFWGSIFILRLADKHASPALRAEGIHFRLEGIISTSIAMAFGIDIILHHYGIATLARYVDPAATLIVSAVIAVPSAHILREAFMKLLDASIAETSQMDVIRTLAVHYDRYCSFKNIRTRSAGRKQFVDMQIIIPEHISIKNAHKIASLIKDDIAAAVKESEVTVHIEPCLRDCAYIKNNQPCPYVAD
jgi:cation diffusion facilitator family transporter